MLGSTIFKYLQKDPQLFVYGVSRSKLKIFENFHNKNIILKDFSKNNIELVIKRIKPEFIINCVGVINHKINKNNFKDAVYANSMFPHILAEFCVKNNITLIHFSTDCVFNGKKGNYMESDLSDCYDFYGKTKFIGEPNNNKTIVIRTSIIGHELNSRFGLLEWFLNEKKKVKGFKNFFFSGLPAVEIAEILHKYILEKKRIKKGIYHLGSKKISKFNLLKIIKKIYNKKNIIISPCYKPIVNKTLNSDYFKKITNYKCPSWKDLIIKMYKFQYEFNIK
jgi:dTDP-4-dehydrorhamnose reductase